MTVFIRSFTSAVLSSALALFLIASVPVPSVASDGAYLTVPLAVGGERIEADGSRGWFAGEWPDIAVAGVRFWDSRTAWLNIEQVPGRMDFDRLDSFVAKAEANRVGEIVLVLGGTPRWAAVKFGSSDAPWMGPGSASPPRSFSAWRDFVSAVASRYAGRISHYEIWNEPNSPTFWSGTQKQWAELVVVASSAIRAADPSATVLASGFLVNPSGNTSRLRPWLQALAGAGCQGCVDALSVHWYSRPKTAAGVSAGIVRRVKAMAFRYGLPGKVWITETNVSFGSCLSLRQQRVEAIRLRDSLARSGAGRSYWYAWTNLDPCGSLPLQPGTPAARVLASGG